MQPPFPQGSIGLKPGGALEYAASAVRLLIRCQRTENSSDREHDKKDAAHDLCFPGRGLLASFAFLTMYSRLIRRDLAPSVLPPTCLIHLSGRK